jgi:hypothetical protein
MICCSSDNRDDDCAQRIAHQPPTRRAALEGAKIATILRAEGGRVHARVGLRFAHNSRVVKETTGLHFSCREIHPRKTPVHLATMVLIGHGGSFIQPHFKAVHS